jgi:hypothetical protein
MLETDRLNTLTEKVIGAAIAVHHELGPGLLETAYEACLAYELMDRGLFFQRQKPCPWSIAEFTWIAATGSTCVWRTRSSLR